ncbi:MAG: cytidyltransferase, partial [Proteobacteria bacterium]|nr:cytidyltransferase [Pseudomonadota bacterium]MBU1612471.1 cytidyltransferase [Pseudomonadota bacterium]
DKYVDKGPHRPAFGQELRLEALASLECVDYCAANEWPTAEETLRTLRPDVYVKGSEFKEPGADPTGKMALEIAVAQEVGTQIRFTEDIVFSSSNLINRFFSQLPEENRQYLQLIKKRYPLETILETLDRMASMKVLVVGDAIVDEYQYCQPLGKSSKDPILAVQFEYMEQFAGGSIAVANHISHLVSEVGLGTVLGKENSHEEFIRSKLAGNVTPHFNTSNDSPTLLKRRIVDGSSTSKLIEIYETPASGLLEPTRNFVDWLQEHAEDYDIVVVCDFGHGTLTPEVMQCLCAKAKFLAVNTQANAGNRGFNVITKYPRLDLGTLAEHELRLERRNNSAPIRQLMEELMELGDYTTLLVTCGFKGCCVFDKTDGFVKIPSLTTHAIDRVGAGDALLSVAALAAGLGATAELLGFLGNVYGALAVGTIGNEKAISKGAASKFITALLK